MVEERGIGIFVVAAVFGMVIQTYVDGATVVRRLLRSLDRLVSPMLLEVVVIFDGCRWILLLEEKWKSVDDGILCMLLIKICRYYLLRYLGTFNT